MNQWLRHRVDSIPIHRLVLFALIGEGIAVAAYILFFPSTRAGDFQAFYFAAERVLDGEPFVGRPPPTGFNTAWVFPPIVVVYFIPLSLLQPWPVAYAFHVGTIIVVSIVATVILRRLLSQTGITLTLKEMILFAAAVIFNPFAITNIAQGQMNMHVVLCILAGVYWSQTDDEYRSGVAFAAAALIKLWPAVLGLWLLWRRQWRAVGAAIITGVSGIILGAVLFGTSATRQWITVITARRSRVAQLSGGMSPDSTMVALERTAAVVLPDATPTVLTAVILSGGFLGVLIIYQQGAMDDRVLATVGVTVSIALLTIPAATLPYLLVPLVLGIGLLFASGTIVPIPRILLSLGVLVSGIPIGLEEFASVMSIIGIDIGEMGVIPTLFTAFPPPIIGLTLMAVSYAMVTIDHSQ